MGLFDLLRRKPAIATSAGLEDFLDRRAAFMAQKCVFEYSRARSGLLSTKLFKEADFRAALDRARWGNYPLCLQSVAVMVEHALRSVVGEESSAMRGGLAAAIAEVCRRYPVPEGFDGDFWQAAESRIVRRIHQAGMAAPHAVKDIPKETAREFFERLPIHADLRSHDFELVTNNLRVNLCRAYEDLLAEADLPVLAGALVAAGKEAAAGRAGG